LAFSSVFRTVSCVPKQQQWLQNVHFPAYFGISPFCSLPSQTAGKSLRIFSFWQWNLCVCVQEYDGDA